MSVIAQDATRVAGGYKATIKNPNVSEEAKANAHERLREMGTSGMTVSPLFLQGPDSDHLPAGVSSDQSE